MAASFAGIRLALLPTDYRSWLEFYHSLTDFTEADLWGYAANGLDHLPLPSVPLPEPPRLGTLVWPSSISKCGYCHCLIDTAGLAAIRTALGSGSAGPANLVLTDGTGNSRTFGLYFLCARPLSQITGSSEQSFLMTLVDKRWFLRQRTGSVTSAPASWTALLSSLASQLGITLTPDTVHSDYSAPTDRWVFQEKPLAVVVDAVCNAIGHRLVANLDGTFSTQSYTTASAAAAAQTAVLTKTAGGLLVASDLVRSVPAAVKVVFNDTSGSSGSSGTPPHTVTKTLAGLAIAGYGAATGVSGQQATVNAELAFTGSNTAACDAYAAAAATDWYNWNLINLDLTYPAVTQWTPTGAEDRVEWVYEKDRILTRVVRPPFQTLTKGGYEPPCDCTDCPPDTEPICGRSPTGSSGGSGHSGSSGSGDSGYPDAEYPGDGQDPFAVRDTVCVGGTLWVTKGRLQVVSVAGRARLDWYDLTTRPEGCCDCGSGSSGGTTEGDCCPEGQDATVPVVLTGPFAAACADLELTGTLTFNAATGLWIGTATGGSVSAAVDLYCYQGSWQFFAIIDLGGGVYSGASGFLTTFADTLTAELQLTGGTGCSDPSLSVEVGHPCSTPPDCGCSQCPDGAPPTYIFTVAGGTGTFLYANGDWTVVQVNDVPGGCLWLGTKGEWTARLEIEPTRAPQLSLTDGLSILSYVSIDVPDCCSPITTLELTGATGTGTIPEPPTVTTTDGCGGCTVTACSCNVPKTLHAHFSGSLAALGTLTLSWTGGTTWTSTDYTGCGNVPSDGVQFVCDGTNWRIPIAGAATVFQVAATPATTCGPFSWTGSGTAVGTCSGAFSVTVNETP